MASRGFGAVVPAHQDGGAARSAGESAYAVGTKKSKMPYDPIRDKDNPKSSG